MYFVFKNIYIYFVALLQLEVYMCCMSVHVFQCYCFYCLSSNQTLAYLGLKACRIF